MLWAGAALMTAGWAVSEATGCKGKLGLPYLSPPACSTTTSAGLMGCVDRARYAADLDFITGERPPQSAQWQAVQDKCADDLAALGFEVERQVYDTGINVVGVRSGTELPDERVLIGAHYDHIPGCDGADDNATGVAAVLEAARVLSTATFTRTLVAACWDEQEVGLLGSSAYVAQAMDRGDKIVMAFNFESIGYRSNEPGSQKFPAGFELIFTEQAAELEKAEYRGDFLLALGDEFARASLQAALEAGTVAELPMLAIELTATQKTSPLFDALRSSDHASFWDADVPSFSVTDTGGFRNAGYHCLGGPDSRDTIDDDFAVRGVQVVVGAAAAALGLQ
jgi:hypothetical protein